MIVIVSRESAEDYAPKVQIVGYSFIKGRRVEAEWVCELWTDEVCGRWTEDVCHRLSAVTRGL